MPQDPQQPPFGTQFAAFIGSADFANERWTEPAIKPLAPMSLHPAAHVLHYSSSCFEGLKAFRWNDDSIRIFRLADHVARMRESAELLCLPYPGDSMLSAMIQAAVDANRASIPARPGALYLRPTIIGTELNIGAAGSAPTQASLFVLCSPVGAYFSNGAKALRIVLEEKAMRAVPGFGQAKTGGNYAAALRHVMRAKQEYQADQVLFCPGGDAQETGASNFMLINDREIVTKPLTDEYLHGVTRDSVLRLAAQRQYRISERDLTAADILDWLAGGGEAALSGTAAVLTGVGTIIRDGQEYHANSNGEGSNTRRLRDELTAVQYGEAADDHDWLTPVPALGLAN